MYVCSISVSLGCMYEYSSARVKEGNKTYVCFENLVLGITFKPLSVLIVVGFNEPETVFRSL